MKTKLILLLCVGFLISNQYTFSQEKTLKNAVKALKGESTTVTTPAAATTCEGNCADGWGKKLYENGYYLGFWQNGLKHGFGLYVWNSGDSYGGNWDKDLMAGFGSYNHASGDGYDGTFKNGVKSGLGRYYSSKENVAYYDEYKDGKVIKTFDMKPTSLSTGCTKGDCENSFGKYEFSNGDYFVGEFISGKLRKGTYYFKNGDIYIGEFNTSTRFEGYGMYVYTDNKGQYTGSWVNGKRNGRGRSVYNEKISIGEWKDDLIIKNMDY